MGLSFNFKLQTSPVCDDLLHASVRVSAGEVVVVQDQRSKAYRITAANAISSTRKIVRRFSSGNPRFGACSKQHGTRLAEHENAPHLHMIYTIQQSV